MRVTIVEKKLHSVFWRINDEKEWRVTATSQGSRVSFSEIPNKLFDELIYIMDLCELTTAGFDICWENDDTSTDAYILELSPLFSINPKVDLKNKNYEYGTYKKKYFIKNSYGLLQQKELLEITFKYISSKMSEIT